MESVEGPLIVRIDEIDIASIAAVKAMDELDGNAFEHGKNQPQQERAT